MTETMNKTEQKLEILEELNMVLDYQHYYGGVASIMEADRNHNAWEFLKANEKILRSALAATSIGFNNKCPFCGKDCSVCVYL